MDEGEHSAVFLKFENALARCVGQEACSSVLVALSGGADSTALLLLFAEKRKKEGTRVEAFHLNHMFRGQEADRDEAFCRELCGRLEIPLTVEKRDAAAFCTQKKVGFEEGARMLRYEALERIRKERGLMFIAVAHNGEDQLETLLFRLARGSAGRGLCGIPGRRGRIVRPLLSFEKRELEQFCVRNGAGYVTDSSNLLQEYARNRIRAQVVPVLRDLCPKIVEAAGHLSAGLREDEEFLCSLLPGKRADVRELRELADPLLKRWLIREYEDCCRETQGKGALGRIHIEDLCRLVRHGRTGNALSLPGNIKAVLGADTLRFSREGAGERGYEEKLSFAPVALGNTGWTACLMEERRFDEFLSKNKKIHSLFMKVALNSATMGKDLFVRSRRAGDRIFFRGMTRQVSKLAAVCKDPELRKIYPVVCDEEGVLWVPGYPIRENFHKEASVTLSESGRIYIVIGELENDLS